MRSEEGKAFVKEDKREKVAAGCGNSAEISRSKLVGLSPPPPDPGYILLLAWLPPQNSVAEAKPHLEAEVWWISDWYYTEESDRAALECW